MAVGHCPGLGCHAPNGAITNLFKKTSSTNHHAVLPNRHAVSPNGAIYTPNGQVFRFWSAKPKLRIYAAAWHFKSKIRKCERAKYIFDGILHLSYHFSSMNIDNRSPILPATLQWQQDCPKSTQFDDIYYVPGQGLHFISVENYPLALPDLCRALSAWPELERCSQALLAGYPPLQAGWHRRSWDNGRIVLDVWFGQALEGLYHWPCAWVDAWYLDGFAPARNPELWQTSLFQACAACSCPGVTTLSTFTAAGDVRRGLQGAGFAMRKQAGFGTKREMLYGHYDPISLTV